MIMGFDDLSGTGIGLDIQYARSDLTKTQHLPVFLPGTLPLLANLLNDSEFIKRNCAACSKVNVSKVIRNTNNQITVAALQIQRMLC